MVHPPDYNPFLERTDPPSTGFWSVWAQYRGRCQRVSPKDSKARLKRSPKARLKWCKVDTKPLPARSTDYIVTMLAQRKAANHVLVLHKALELATNFMGRLLDPDFSKRAMKWYYRFIKSRLYNLSFQRPTSAGQKRPAGQDLWRTVQNRKSWAL
jgi:hypothetical protein